MTLVVVNHGWQSQHTDGSKGGWSMLECRAIYLPIYLSFYLFVYVSSCLSIYLSVFPSIYQSIHLSICLSISLSFFLSVCLSVFLQAWNSARLAWNLTVESWKRKLFFLFLRDFLQIWKLTIPKTQQFCKNSSIFKGDKLKNEAILQEFLQEWKVEYTADGLVPMRFVILPLHLSKGSKALHLREKVRPGHTKCCTMLHLYLHLSSKIF